MAAAYMEFDMTKNTNEATGYKVAFKNWPTKLAGPKPSQALLDQVHALGCRAGKQALAMAMYAREGGASDGQVKAACIAGWGSSGSHHNKRRDLVGAGLVKEINKGVSDAQGHKVYAIQLTAKGTAKLAKPVEAKPAKPAKAAKAAKEKPVAVVTEPVPGVSPEVQAQATA